MYKINIWVQTLQRSPVIPVCTVWRGWWRRPWLTSNLPRPPLESGGLSPDYRRVRVWYCGPRYFDQPRCFIRLAQLWSANITTNWEYALLACIDYAEIIVMEARHGSRKGCLYIFILLTMKLTLVQGGASLFLLFKVTLHLGKAGCGFGKYSYCGTEEIDCAWTHLGVPNQKIWNMGLDNWTDK